MESTEIIIRENGTLTERIIRERDLDAGQSTLDALTEEVTRPLRNILTISPWGLVHANVGRLDTIWSVPLDRLELHTRFRLINDILTPAFASHTEVEMHLTWQRPQDLDLIFAVRTADSDQGVRIDGNWLFARAQNQRMYRLPLPNLHDDCLLCTGRFQEEHDTGREAVMASLEQFRQSKWNADLMRTVEQSQKFFRFLPTNESFETLPVEANHWTELCEKVSTTVSERIIL